MTHCRGVLLAGAVTALPLPALGQAWPSPPISVIVPFPPGRSNDLLARPLAQKLQQALGGHPVVVDNRGGAGGTVGVAQVARATHGGHTLMCGHVSTLTVDPWIYPNIPNDTLRISRRWRWLPLCHR
jgi:tripartite-type tricarboxylate transporter receptor subunit TctC